MVLLSLPLSLCGPAVSPSLSPCVLPCSPSVSIHLSSLCLSVGLSLPPSLPLEAFLFSRVQRPCRALRYFSPQPLVAPRLPACVSESLLPSPGAPCDRDKRLCIRSSLFARGKRSSASLGTFDVPLVATSLFWAFYASALNTQGLHVVLCVDSKSCYIESTSYDAGYTPYSVEYASYHLGYTSYYVGYRPYC